MAAKLVGRPDLGKSPLVTKDKLAANLRPRGLVPCRFRKDRGTSRATVYRYLSTGSTTGLMCKAILGQTGLGRQRGLKARKR